MIHSSPLVERVEQLSQLPGDRDLVDLFSLFLDGTDEEKSRFIEDTPDPDDDWGEPTESGLPTPRFLYY